MKNIVQVLIATLPWLQLLFVAKGFCEQRVDCQWGSYGEWSECDGCTKLQTRSRVMAVYRQFGGTPCDGGRTETRPCETTKGCPLEDGCGDRFRCRSGKCISQSLVCNGDQDCEEDGLDENCGPQKYIVCTDSALPPNIELLGFGFDVVSGKQRASVINTKSFGGQCRTIFSGVHAQSFRLPLSTIQYSFMVKAQNDFSDEMFTSQWHYAKDIVKRATVSGTITGYKNYDYHESHDRSQMQKVLILKNDIEVAQFQSNAPQYIPISEEFWKSLVNLPSVYDLAAYRKVLERFGTHYLAEGSLGGSLKVVVKIGEETEKFLFSESSHFHECERTKRWILFFPIYHETCRSGGQGSSSSSNVNTRGTTLKRVDVKGGGISQIAQLETMKPADVEKNWESYSNWADSVRSFPQVTNQKLRPLSELVKEVQCAGVKKLYLRRAIEQYLSETDSCHCRPCRNNGMVFMDGDECKCICKPGTSGLACEHGADLEDPQGGTHGSWSCWSPWSSCSGTRRSRSRTCSNPIPQNGGRHCIGDSIATSDCEDQDLEYLKTMEPQCFRDMLQSSQRCATPPALINGYILDLQDLYLVGSKVEYSCTDGFHLIGLNIIECNSDQTWSGRPGLCTVSSCKLESLADGVIASPLHQAYGIGDSVTLSCPVGRQLLGETTIICDPSLHFSPNPTDIKCSPGQMPQLQLVQCETWEKPSRGQCVCKMPSECGSSLEVCATFAVNKKSVLVSVCQMHALKCLGKSHIIAEDSSCTWPERNATQCTKCHMWETCNDQTNECRCKDSADCSNPGSNVCVRVGDNADQTMSECEAGLRRCKGENVSVVSILPCTS